MMTHRVKPERAEEAIPAAGPGGPLPPRAEPSARSGGGGAPPSCWTPAGSARAEEARFPICVHIGSFLRSAPASAPKGDGIWKPSLGFVARAAWTKSGGQTLDVTCDLLFSGIFERHPRLRILLVESNIGWIPTLLEQSDDMFRRYRWWTGAHKEMSEMPSRIFHRNFWATFMVDRSGIELRHRLNVDHLMWSTDYPHSGCDWPDSGLVIERVFEGVPKAEVRKMLHENAKRLYQLDHVPDRLPG